MDNLKKSWSKYDDDALNKLLNFDNKRKIKDVYRQFSSNLAYHLLAYGVKAKTRKKQFIEFDCSNIKLKILKDDETQVEVNNSTFYIRENELQNKFDLVVSRILQFIGKSKRIFARKCHIKEIDTKTYSAFCKENHIQDSSAASIKIGLFENSSNNLVSVMSFSRPRFTNKYDFELLRFCHKAGFTVVGGASKMFSYFLAGHPGAKIVSYADKRWSRGNVYFQLGFKLADETKSSFFYFKDGVIISRYQAQKHRLKSLLTEFDNDKTEVENMTSSGYKKVLNPGQYVFVYQN
jgi:hypothetical protein